MKSTAVRRPAAATASVAFFLLAPGTMAGIIPWLITRWELTGHGTGWTVLRTIGVLLIVAGAVPPIAAFVGAGGTPIPVAPTQRLVVDGFNRHLRNPMYAGLTVVILGQALLFGSTGLVIWAAVFWAVTASFVRFYEEPTLIEQYDGAYLDYRRNVPAWWPRLRPWSPPV